MTQFKFSTIFALYKLLSYLRLQIVCTCDKCFKGFIGKVLLEYYLFYHARKLFIQPSTYSKNMYGKEYNQIVCVWCIKKKKFKFICKNYIIIYKESNCLEFK